MKIIQLIGLFICIICTDGFYSCVAPNKAENTAAKAGAARKDDRKKIDSLVLVHSLPIYLSTGNPLFNLEIKVALLDSLKKRGYKIISQDENNGLFKAFIMEKAGIGDPDKIAKAAESIRRGEQYFQKAFETGDPFSQMILFHPCEPFSDTCLRIERRNYPNVTKQKNWVFQYKQTADHSTLVHQIIEALTTQNQ